MDLCFYYTQLQLEIIFQESTSYPSKKFLYFFWSENIIQCINVLNATYPEILILKNFIGFPLPLGHRWATADSENGKEIFEFWDKFFWQYFQNFWHYFEKFWENRKKDACLHLDDNFWLGLSNLGFWVFRFFLLRFRIF